MSEDQKSTIFIVCAYFILTFSSNTIRWNLFNLSFFVLGIFNDQSKSDEKIFLIVKIHAVGRLYF